jgi:hypothetical protein
MAAGCRRRALPEGFQVFTPVPTLVQAAVGKRKPTSATQSFSIGQSAK